MKILIFYNDEHQALLEQLKLLFQEFQVSFWLLKENSTCNSNNLEYLKKQLASTDYFLILLSQKSSHSEILSKALEYSLKLHQERKDFRPYIVTLIYGDSSLSSQSMILESKTYNFSDFACFKVNHNFETNQLRDFVQQLYPRVTFISDPEVQADILESSFQCYGELFPDPAIRDDPEDIIDWLYEEQYQESNTKQNVYAVLHLLNYAIGMAFFVAYPEQHKCFGGYFGVRFSWRQQNRVNWFIKQLSNKLQQIDPDLEDIIFEVDTIDFKLLETVSQQKTISGQRNEEKILHSLRSLRRLILFQYLGGLVLLQSDDTPCPYLQPALQEPLDCKNEREFMIMVISSKHIQQEHQKLIKILNFVYDDVYKNCSGEDSITAVVDYEPYIDQLKKQITDQIQHDLYLGKIEIPSSILQLLWRVKKEGLSDRLAL